MTAATPATPLQFGTGPEPGLAIHCSLARAEAWGGVGAALGARMTLQAIDLPGHGRAPDVDRAAPGDQQALAMAWAIAAIEARGVGPVHLMGHSFGGTVALRLAITRPDLVRSLSLFEPVLFGIAAGLPGHAESAAQFEPFDAALAAGNREEAARLFTGAWGVGPRSWDAMRPAARRAITAQIDLIALQSPGLSDEAGNIIGPGRLERVTAPLLLMTGSDSPPVVEEICDRIAARVAASPWPVLRSQLPGQGHMAPITAPGLVAAQIARQLDRAGAVQPASAARN